MINSDIGHNKMGYSGNTMPIKGIDMLIICIVSPNYPKCYVENNAFVLYRIIILQYNFSV